MVAETVSNEMDAMARILHGSAATLTPEYLTEWSLQSAVAVPSETTTPTLLKVLRCAISTETARKKNKKKESETACFSIIGQLASRRSQLSSLFASPMSLFFWRTGCSRQTIETLNAVGLCRSYTATLQLIDQLGENSMLLARGVASGPLGSREILGGFDNINMSRSDFIEQRPGAPAKVQSGTFPVIYRLRNGKYIKESGLPLREAYGDLGRTEMTLLVIRWVSGVKTSTIHCLEEYWV
ncbi:hypothetical protein ARMGADRAFT_1024169 [Armillaria gallica]|uniref:Uncharacterized protein n=1 Tax=Armillaria gallica TaxID=47427 RepID=A0A2H3E1U2_ARMGA|nr:hypothetical protein ARMGADRAFT_1024169 [Armillaria gallica]